MRRRRWKDHRNASTRSNCVLFEVQRTMAKSDKSGLVHLLLTYIMHEA